MKIRRSGIRFIVLHFLCWAVVAALFWLFCSSKGWNIAISVIGLYMSFFVATFFRVPDRKPLLDDSLVISPGDGNVINIEEVEEEEYFHERRIRVSVFMTFFNVHVNWYPVSGEIRYVKYNPGGKVFAMYAKSSEKNEHTSIVVRTDSGVDILFRQIAGIVARRIECDAVEGNRCTQGDVLGMIKFGSRLDIFLPLGTELLVSKGDLVRGRLSPIARIGK
jgi:phosphatidylserine decarboxylase